MVDRVSGKLMPVRVTWESLMFTEFTVRPPFNAVIVAGWETVVPTVTVPKPIAVGATLRLGVAGIAPVPVRDIVTAPLLALLLIVMVALTAPAACGANVTEKVTGELAFTVSGGVRPVTEKEDDPESEEDCTDTVPEELRVMVLAWELPTVTVPKSKDAGKR